MHSEQDRAFFSKRLKSAIELNGWQDLSLADLATRFNLKHPNKPVSPQAVHSWLIGVSIPTPDKLETLAKLFNTSVDWLRYGKIEMEGGTLTPNEALMLNYFRELNAKKQEVMIAMLAEFIKDSL